MVARADIDSPDNPAAPESADRSSSVKESSKLEIRTRPPSKLYTSFMSTIPYSYIRQKRCINEHELETRTTIIIPAMRLPWTIASMARSMRIPSKIHHNRKQKVYTPSTPPLSSLWPTFPSYEHAIVATDEASKIGSTDTQG